MLTKYRKFLEAKLPIPQRWGFAISLDEINPILKPHQKLLVQWAVAGGRRAIFAKFGLGKSVIQLEVCRLLLLKSGGKRGLITAPLGVRQEFKRDAEMLGLKITFIRSIDDASEPGLYLANFETIRDGKLDPTAFDVCSLDEASVLRGFGGTKTFREFMRVYEGVAYRFVATAIPDPNETIELLAYAAFLGIMDVGQAKTRFFKRNSEKADQLTLHPHKVREFWLWVASWAVFLQKPSDIGCSDEGYTLPALEVRWHEIPVDHSVATVETNGQHSMFRGAVKGVVQAAREKRDTLDARVGKMLQIIRQMPDEHFLLWHDLEAERHAIERALPQSVSVYGTQDLDERERAIIQFSDGEIQYLAAKPVIAGSGCNFQRHCSREIFVGIGFKFNDFIQAIHRCYRFLQPRPVIVDVIYAESEREVKRRLLEKWAQYEETVQKMSEIIREYGLNHADMLKELSRSMGVERVEVRGENYVVAHNDCIPETKKMATGSVDLVLTSIPFSTQYEYSPNYADMGHTDSNEHFFEQMDFLTPELLRTLKPGRVAAIHVKDRIVPGGMTGLGFQTVYPFHMRVTEHFMKHGFAYMGMKTIVTDVVRENNQTYRLGWSEQCKDGTKMGVGMPEYLLLFRKPPSESNNSYADKPVKKSKPNCLTADGEEVPFSRDLPIAPGTGYSRARWQVDAHGFTRSSGERLLTPEELAALPHDAIFKLFRQYNLENVYDFEHHVKLGEALEAKRILPVTFMLLQPQSWHPEVWSDVTRMLTLNGAQHAKGKEMHLCPMQFDIADRAIIQFTEPGETVYDPFGGLMTVPYRALKLKRKGRAAELNNGYFLDGCKYLEMAEREMNTPTLFDLTPEMEALPEELATAS
jgi:DNA modification methylase